ncbi:hypothetical protein TNCV_429921, partial [Trichonephila clavipes]
TLTVCSTTRQRKDFAGAHLHAARPQARNSGTPAHKSPPRSSSGLK